MRAQRVAWISCLFCIAIFGSLIGGTVTTALWLLRQNYDTYLPANCTLISEAIEPLYKFVVFECNVKLIFSYGNATNATIASPGNELPFAAVVGATYPCIYDPTQTQWNTWNGVSKPPVQWTAVVDLAYSEDVLDRKLMITFWVLFSVFISGLIVFVVLLKTGNLDGNRTSFQRVAYL